MTPIPGYDSWKLRSDRDELPMLETAREWSDLEYSALELDAAIAFWRANHTAGSRSRVRRAIAYFREYHQA